MRRTSHFFFAPLFPLFLLIALLAPLLAAAPARADFDEGRAAFERGDFATAFAIAERQAYRGDAEAQGYLGIMHYYGQGTPHDHKEAAQWYRAAADQGYTQAQMNLGVLYATGDGVEHDMIEAYKWFFLATKGGGAVADQNLALAKRKLTPGQIKEAEARIRTWEKARGK